MSSYPFAQNQFSQSDESDESDDAPYTRNSRFSANQLGDKTLYPELLDDSTSDLARRKPFYKSIFFYIFFLIFLLFILIGFVEYRVVKIENDIINYITIKLISLANTFTI
jgi:hypothetical protein